MFNKFDSLKGLDLRKVWVLEKFASWKKLNKLSFYIRVFEDYF